MAIKLACAPCCWGVESAKNGNNPSWQTVLEEARQAGFSGLELGPYGFLPTDGDVLSAALKENGLEVVAGTLFEPLWDKKCQVDILVKTYQLCAVLKSIGCNRLVVIDSVNDVRSKYAGLPDEAPRLDEAHWQHMMETIRWVATIAREKGIRAVVHPHAGGYIEYKDEIDRMLEEVSAEDAGLCLDTGHLYYAGMDPVQSLAEYAFRLEYVHFKDIHKDRLENAIERRTGFWQACADGVMCPIGEGDIDYAGVEAALKQIGYEGWITIEQERDPRDCATTLPDITRSREYLVERGYRV